MMRGGRGVSGGMMNPTRFLAPLFVCLIVALGVAAEPLRVGVIGLDTSHAVEFTAILNTPRPAGAEMRTAGSIPSRTRGGVCAAAAHCYFGGRNVCNLFGSAC